MTDLTIKEAYLAMYQFMATIIRRDGNEEFLHMIGGMSFLQDGSTADLGMWHLWKQAIGRIGRSLTDHLTVEEAHAAMCSFLEHWNSLGPDEDMTRILPRMHTKSSNQQRDEGLWADWIEAVQAAKSNQVVAELKLPSKQELARMRASGWKSLS